LRFFANWVVQKSPKQILVNLILYMSVNVEKMSNNQHITVLIVTDLFMLFVVSKLEIKKVMEHHANAYTVITRMNPKRK